MGNSSEIDQKFRFYEQEASVEKVIFTRQGPQAGELIVTLAMLTQGWQNAMQYSLSLVGNSYKWEDLPSRLHPDPSIGCLYDNLEN